MKCVYSQECAWLTSVGFLSSYSTLEERFLEISRHEIHEFYRKRVLASNENVKITK